MPETIPGCGRNPALKTGTMSSLMTSCFLPTTSRWLFVMNTLLSTPYIPMLRTWIAFGLYWKPFIPDMAFTRNILLQMQAFFFELFLYSPFFGINGCRIRWSGPGSLGQMQGPEAPFRSLPALRCSHPLTAGRPDSACCSFERSFSA